MGRSRSNSENPQELVLASDPALAAFCVMRENRGMSSGVAGGERRGKRPSVRVWHCVLHKEQRWGIDQVAGDA